MKNLLKINDVVTVLIPGFTPDEGVIVTIDDTSKWADGTTHYGGKYKQAGYNGAPDYHRGIQFTEDQCVLPEVKAKTKEKVKAPIVEPAKETTKEPTKEPVKETLK